ncbi:MAG: methionine--tRNA ligase [Candidatus Micrarchaeota archaeon]|nr:methionine--tRNA ligase [Candidatus Micrarchaeota archaeon]
MRKILITAALPYSNNLPHLGTLIGCVLSADVFARYNRLMQRECIYICGTDEYGTATEIKALEEGISPQELCDKYYLKHKEIYDWFDISFDIFGRTSSPKHTQIVQEIFLDLYKNGYIFEKEIQQPYDEKLGIFLADRFVIGTCPYCSYPEARADQCDSCGKLLDFSLLIDPVSKLSKTKPILKYSKHLFLDLPKLEDKIRKFILEIEQKGLWSKNTLAVAKSWLESGLQPRAITRDLKWGIKVPLKGWENKVFYVWFDAPIGYISITANLTEKYMEWWGGAKEVEHYEFIGKDNIPFHAIIFPATLMGTKRNWTLVHFISATEFLNFSGLKFSKSKKIGIFGDDAIKSGIDSDVWRYYLIANRPESSDTNFSWEDFEKRTNNELVANLANLVNRTLVFIYNNFGGIVPQPKLGQLDLEFLEEQKIIAAQVGSNLEKVHLRAALEKLMEFCSNANKYFQAKEPWNKIKTDPTDAKTTMFVLANIVFDIAILSEPFLPKTSKRILEQLNIFYNPVWTDLNKFKIQPGHKIQKPYHLFTKLEKDKIQQLKNEFTPSLDEELLNNINLEIGQIISVALHPNASNLYVQQVQLSDKTIQIVAGLAKFYSPQELLNKKCIIVKNLEPKIIRGIKSEGMLLAAQSEKMDLELIQPPGSVGQTIEFEDFKQTQQNSKLLKFEDFLKIKFEVKGGVCYANGKKMLVNNKEIKTKKVLNGLIK